MLGVVSIGNSGEPLGHRWFWVGLRWMDRALLEYRILFVQCNVRSVRGRGIRSPRFFGDHISVNYSNGYRRWLGNL